MIEKIFYLKVLKLVTSGALLSLHFWVLLRCRFSFSLQLSNE